MAEDTEGTGDTIVGPEWIGVLGGGAWGSALAQAAARAERAVALYHRDRDYAGLMRMRRENPRYLPGHNLHEAIAVTGDITTLSECDAVIVACPAQALRAALASLADFDGPLILAAKGIERASGMRLSDVAHAVAPKAPIAVLSGPTFAHEVMAGLPSAATLACVDGGQARALAQALSSTSFRLYWSDDVTGVELGGALKNVIAIACGIARGKQLGENAVAALIARGLAELMRFGACFGARAETLVGLSGMGDLVLTASSPTSRNTSLGIDIGEGRSVEELLRKPASLAEGAHTAQAVADLADRHDLDMPICQAVAAVLRADLSPDDAIEGLLGRPLQPEARSTPLATLSR